MSKALCCYAFETLINKLNVLDSQSSKHSMKNYFDILQENIHQLPKQAPLFITWNKNDHLRGCIGTFQNLPIESGIAKFSISSALNDPRFPPISKSEINSKLSVSVTLLENFIEIKDYYDWTIGLNGLKISFNYDNEHYSGTFLPSVAEDQDWDKLTTLYYLLQKAEFSIAKKNVEGFYKKGLKEGWMKLSRYDGVKGHLDYDGFIKIRQMIDKP
ncbi:uncharacterized protein J8A68_001788 [[Candida] subhashii]|uniref:AMMECR1 domain-containing protein n=1 Tax=[Candida] subhashii TaxID=561895 RepID=A0A8J5QQ80_9ASCO|nr:uncharacterized protein J8A68_001788 [[Candida] subhashii]KAG7664691.1 hypothetical protein J8A68_001788 [[Candida] subhashii]